MGSKLPQIYLKCAAYCTCIQTQKASSRVVVVVVVVGWGVSDICEPCSYSSNVTEQLANPFQEQNTHKKRFIFNESAIAQIFTVIIVQFRIHGNISTYFVFLYFIFVLINFLLIVISRHEALHEDIHKNKLAKSRWM